MTDKQQERLKQIRERLAKNELASYAPDEWWADTHFLLSLVDSQVAVLVQPSQIVRSDGDVRQLFEAWWKVNHPFSWWAEERGGQPLLEPDRQIVKDLTERAFYAAEVLSLTTATSMRSACIEKVKAKESEYREKRTVEKRDGMEYAAMQQSAKAEAALEIRRELESLTIQEQEKANV